MALPEPDEAEEGVKASETETEKVREESRATRPAGTAGAAQETRVSPGDAAAADALISARGVVYPPEPGYAARFNAALDAALAAPAGKKALASFEALECTPRAAADLALVALCRMDRDKGVVTAQDIAKATQALLADTYVRSLSGASVLELCLVVAMSRLHRFRNMPSFNFQHVEAELRTMAANDFLGDAGRAKGPVLTRAFEGLLAMGLVEACAGVGAEVSREGRFNPLRAARGRPAPRLPAPGISNSFAASSCSSPTRRWRWRWRNTRRNRRGSRSCSCMRVCEQPRGFRHLLDARGRGRSRRVRSVINSGYSWVVSSSQTARAAVNFMMDIGSGTIHPRDARARCGRAPRFRGSRGRSGARSVREMARS